MGFGLNGAEIVFNPSATVGELSEPMWSIEVGPVPVSGSKGGAQKSDYCCLVALVCLLSDAPSITRREPKSLAS
jgi:hypothetical protein